MKRTAVLGIVGVLAGCGQAAKPVQQSIGALCGIPDLQVRIFGPPTSKFVIDEERLSGSLNDPPRPVPISKRQYAVEKALPCIEIEARRRGLTVVSPITEVD